MWPEKGSGFEASQYSPAGGIQRGWRVVRLANEGCGYRRHMARLFIVIGTAPLLAFLGWEGIKVLVVLFRSLPH